MSDFRCDNCNADLKRPRGRPPKERKSRPIERWGLIPDAEQDVRWFCDQECLLQWMSRRNNEENQS